MKKILFFNISGTIHSNNISEILILLEYFRNMYPCHRRFKQYANKTDFKGKKYPFRIRDIAKPHLTFLSSAYSYQLQYSTILSLHALVLLFSSNRDKRDWAAVV